MALRLLNLVAALSAATVSVAGSAYYIAGTISNRLLVSPRYRQQVTVPPALLPPGSKQQLTGKLIDGEDRRQLAAAIWREPTVQALANTLYVNLKETGAPTVLVERQAELLSALGWRNTASQVSLLLHDLFGDRPTRVLDRGDALLRRHQVLALANQMMAVLEATPQTQALVAQRLAQRPPWRSDYLVATSQSATPAFLATRVMTLAALMRAGLSISNREISPVLTGLVAIGNGASAYRLWVRSTGRAADAPIVNDGDFVEVDRRGFDAGPILPFDWQLQTGIGYNAVAAEDGSSVSINWNGRGVPPFLVQLVPVRTGTRYALTIKGQANASSLAQMLAPTIVCNGRQVAFDVATESIGTIVFRSDPVPTGCPVAPLVISGHARDSSAPVSATLVHVAMKPIG